MGSKLLFTSLLLLLLFFTTRDGNGMIMKVDARTCESQSHGFKGTCLSERNCRLVCKNEGFPGGKCVGVRRRCFCTRPCP